MAEATGLALGIVALVGVFEDCICLFSQIAAAESLGRDYEILNTKLDIEKALLLQWADRLALLEPNDYDRRLDNPGTAQIIHQTLASVELLLSESNGLQQRYGLRPVEQGETAHTSTIMSARLMNRLHHESRKLRLRIEAHSENKALFLKVRWVIKDKEKFDVLIRDLSHFTIRLNALVPDRQTQSQSPLREEIGSIRSVRNLQLVLDASVDNDKNLAELTREAVTTECTRRILELLWFRMLGDREDNVAVAHSRTLQWSGTRNFTTACFFLWNLGTLEQKSQAGLGRGLLYHVLNVNKHLIPRILPKMWRQAQKPEETLELPSDREMQEAFSLLGREDADGSYCFFIDGLDEYSGNYREGISFIKKLVTSSNIKVLVSSRPIVDCVEAFSRNPKLLLQDLTEKDIELYITDTIRSHPYMNELLRMDSNTTEKLLVDLRHKASGVFLWVILACRSLLDGFAASDYPVELQRRVDELPPELEELFQHMLGKIQPRYRIQAAKLLRLCHQDRQLGISECICTMGLALVDEQEMNIYSVPRFRPNTFEEGKRKCERLEGRLRSRCCGLLEVHKARKAPLYCFCGNESNHDSLIHSTVDFMHRTVFEFLNCTEAWTLDCLQVPDSDFDTTAILSCMTSYQVYLQEQPIVGTDDSCEFLKQNLEYARRVDKSYSGTRDSLAAVNSHFEAAILERQTRSNRFGIETFLDHIPKIPGQVALLLAVEADMINYVHGCENLPEFSSKIRPQPYPLLYHAICRPFLSRVPTLSKILSAKMIEILLRSDCDVNEEFRNDKGSFTTPWKTWQGSVSMVCRNQRSALLAAEVTAMMLKAGADFEPFNAGGLLVPGESHFVIKVGQWHANFGSESEGSSYYALTECCGEILRLVDEHLMLKAPGALPGKHSGKSISSGLAVSAATRSPTRRAFMEEMDQLRI